MARARCLAAAWVLAAGAAGCEEYIEIGRVAQGIPQGGPGIVDPSDAAGVDGPPLDASPIPEVGQEDASSVDVPPDAGIGDASSDPIASDATSTILWSSSNENGDLSDWTGNGPSAGGSFVYMADLSASRDRAHTGSYSIRVGFDTADNMDHGGGVYHRMELAPAYYGAWFFLTAAHVPKVWWTLFHIFYEREAGNFASRQGLCDINLNRTTLYFYDERTTRFVDATPQKPFPIGQWVHVEAYAGYDPVRGGRVKVWLDGDLILDVSGIAYSPSSNLYWGIGSETGGVTPSLTTMYIDDATISTTRVGP